MMKPTAISAAWLASLVAASAQTTQPVETDPSLVPGIDFLRAGVVFTNDMEIEDGPGDLDVGRFEFRSLLSEPIPVVGGLSVIPVFTYNATDLEFSGTGAGFPISDEGLHALAFSAFFFHTTEGSPWIIGGWTRAEMASDFQHIDGDDFTFDVAAGVGYKVSDCFTIGIGGTVVNLNGDTEFFPGINFDWVPSDQVRVGLYGPMFIASYTPDENWKFSVRGDSGGGDWNITSDGGESRTIDLSTYRAGLFVNRRLTENLRLEVGAGMTFANEIQLSKTSGNDSFDRDLDGGLFGEVALRVKSW